MRTIICSKHPGLPAWIKKHHPDLYGSEYMGGEALVVDEVTPEMARGNRIIGDLVPRLMRQCPEYWQVIYWGAVSSAGEEFELLRWKPCTT